LQIGVKIGYKSGRNNFPETFRFPRRPKCWRFFRVRRLLIVTIPDFSVTPTGARYSRRTKHFGRLTRFNEIINDEARAQSESCRCILDQQSNETDPY